MIYSGDLCVAVLLWVSMYGRVLHSVSFIAQQVGRVIKGCQWGIWPLQIIQLLFLQNILYLSATPLDHSGIPAPLLITITQPLTQKEKAEIRWPLRPPWNSISACHRTTEQLYHNSEVVCDRCVFIKTISVICFKLHYSVFNKIFQLLYSWWVPDRFSPEAYASIPVTCMSFLRHVPLHLGEPHHQKLSVWIVNKCRRGGGIPLLHLFFSSPSPHSFLSQCITGL